MAAKRGRIPNAEPVLGPQQPPQSTPLFEYESLPEDSIRILNLLPGSVSDPICCNLEIALRSSDTGYSALSYTWGLEPDVYRSINILEVVSIDRTCAVNRRILVRPNLHNALVALRANFAPNPTRLWIDAVCINQSSNLEKQQQVRHMDSVYINAADVVIWLGESGYDSQFVLDSIARNDDATFVTPRFMDGILRMLEREWFTRTWVVQEFVLNRKPSIMTCGTADMVCWDCFRDAYIAAFPWVKGTSMTANIGDEQALFMGQNVARWTPLHHKYTMLNSFRKGVQSRDARLTTYALRFALWATQPFKATDARDRVYGVLGMTHEEVKEQIVPDYGKSKEEVFRDAIVYILQHERRASVYTYTLLNNAETRKDNPSWVPNFDGADRGYGVAVPLFDEDLFPQHRADAIRLSDCKQRLTVKGLLLDEIQTIVVHPAPQVSQTTLWAEVWNKSFMLTRFENVVQLCASKPGSPRTTEPLWKLMLLSGATMDQFRDEEECQSKFDILMAVARDMVALHSAE